MDSGERQGEDAKARAGQARRESDHIGRSLLHALRNANISVFYQDPELRYVWGENIPQSWTSVLIEGARDHDFLPYSEAERLFAAKTLVIETGEPSRLEIATPRGAGSRCWYDVSIDADRDQSGRVVGLISTVVEITDRKEREQTLRTLLREVSHRSKNLLAIIQSIATQTGRHADSIGEFLKRFSGRIQSISASQDLVTSSNWRGADLHELITGQVLRYSADPASSLRIEGENPYLTPNAALHVGLSLHELAVNSLSYGALSRSEGKVTIATRFIDGPDGGRDFEMVWTESGGPPQPASPRPRFGSVALEKVVPSSLNGKAELETGPAGVRYRLVMPDSNVVDG